MKEITSNIHIHSRFSDGSGTYKDIINAAVNADIDVVILTDHNVKVRGIERYYSIDNKKVMMLIGEEVHNKSRIPQKNHLLAIGVDNELCKYSNDPQSMIDKINMENGLSFLAHPFETDLPEFGEPDISWEDWTISNYTGIELWNQLSEFKYVANSILRAILYALFPSFIAHGPDKDTLNKWDELTLEGKQIVAIGGSDSHALIKKYGPIKKTIFPYEFHFRGINTHILLPSPLTGYFIEDRESIINAIRMGHCFIGYDWPASTNGFRFSAQNLDSSVIMGDHISLNSPVTIQIKTPQKSKILLLKDGSVIKSWNKHQSCVFTTKEIGVYRVESEINYLGKSRGWIYSNPIYIVE